MPSTAAQTSGIDADLANYTSEDAYLDIMDALEDGELEEAKGIIAWTLKRWPHSVRLQLARGEVLSKTVGNAGAARHYLALLNGGPAHPWALARVKPILVNNRFPREQTTLIVRALIAAKIDDRTKLYLIDLLLQALEPADLITVLRAVAPSSGLFRLEWKLAVTETEQGNIEAATTILTKSRSEGRSNDTAATLLSDLLATSNRLPEAIALLEEAIAKDPDRPEPHRRLIGMLQRAGDNERASELLHSVAARWPGDWMLLFRKNRLPMAPDRMRAIYDTVAPAADAAAERDERYRLQFALAALHVGEIERAWTLFRKPFTPAVASMAMPVIRAVGARGQEFWHTASRLDDNRLLDVQIVRAPGARMTVVLPTGIAFGYLPMRMVDALFAQHGVNVVYLRDFRKRAYLRGVASLGKDEADTIIALKGILNGLGAPRTVVMGASLGGFGAMRIGHQLGAYAAVSFAGPTDLNVAYEDTKANIWNPSHFLKILLQREGDLPTDLKPLLANPGQTRFIQLYGETDVRDARQAQRLDGMRNVAVLPVRGVGDHIVVNHMIADGSFDALLRTLAT